MTDSDSKPFTPKEGCEECKQLRGQEDYSIEAKSHLTYGVGTGYRRGKSRSQQFKHVRELMDRNENAERLAQARLRLHEIEAHEGGPELHKQEYLECMTILLRNLKR